MSLINNLDLFAGIGAWHRASLIVSEVFGYQLDRYAPTISVEIDDLVNEIRSAKFKTELYKDVKEFDLEVSFLNFLYMSFPCHGTSSMGKREGLTNINSALFWEGLRIIKLNMPRFIIIEQPEGIIKNGLSNIVSELESLRYRTAVIMLSARAFYLPHRRNRVFIIASDTYNLCNRVYGKSGWSNDFRETFEGVRNYSLRVQIESGICRQNDGNIYLSSDYCHNVAIKNYSNRNMIINALARSIVPYCAAVPIAFLMKVHNDSNK